MDNAWTINNIKKTFYVTFSLYTFFCESTCVIQLQPSSFLNAHAEKHRKTFGGSYLLDK